ncbi:hypothetical protein [Wolbachia endosymbiont of Ctenocephalides felis wCfeT]|uniref:hypothetical protein n=1 Tax=Wolbachia endosymbiont of Ctenocephalides felis wCfeT TaxID=2732593 RepID=UPI0014477078|nr:hypothetical protein [Wolbachia endosymbiont of Ctenocephalides felis wCfeT]
MLNYGASTSANVAEEYPIVGKSTSMDYLADLGIVGGREMGTLRNRIRTRQRLSYGEAEEIVRHLRKILAQKYLSKGEHEKVKEFFQDCDISFLNHIGKDCNTLVHIAAEFAHYDIMQISLSRVIAYDIGNSSIKVRNILDKNAQGKTLLHLAVENKHLVGVTDDRKDIEEKHKKGITDESFDDIKKRHIKSVEAFPDKYLNKLVNVQDDEGNTPLHIAVLHVMNQEKPSQNAYDYDITKKLLTAKSADTEIKDNDGESIYDYIKKVEGFKDKKLIYSLIQHNKKQKKYLDEQFKRLSKKAQVRENQSKKYSKIAVGSAIVSECSNALYEYNIARHALHFSHVIKALAIVPYPAGFLLTAMALHHSSSSHNKKCCQLDNDRKQNEVEAERLRSILKDIEYKERIAKLETDLQNHNHKTESGSSLNLQLKNSHVNKRSLVYTASVPILIRVEKEVDFGLKEEREKEGSFRIRSFSQGASYKKESKKVGPQTLLRLRKLSSTRNISSIHSSQ